MEKYASFFNQATRCSLLYAEKTGIGMKMEACDGWNDKCKFAKDGATIYNRFRPVYICLQAERAMRHLQIYQH